MNILITLIIGAFIGWVASGFVGADHSLLVYIIIGLLGSSLGGSLFGRQGKLLGYILTSIAGAIILLLAINFLLTTFPNLIR